MEKARFKSNEFSLTYPRCAVSASDYMGLMKVKFSDKLTYIAVAQEKHVDDGFHLHAQLQFEKPYSATERSFDFPFGGDVSFHPNVQTTKSSSDWAKYIAKESVPVSWGTFSELHKLRCSKKKEKLTNRDLLTRDIKEMVDTDAVSIYSIRAILHARALYATLGKSDKIRLGSLLPPFWKDISMPVKMEEKQKHYWLWSDMPNRGKTKFQLLLESTYDCYRYSYKEEYQTPLAGTEVLLFDEYGKGSQIQVTSMNSICDGTFTFIRKGREGIRINPLVVVCSNFSIRDCYPNHYDKVEARFIEICLNLSESI